MKSGRLLDLTCSPSYSSTGDGRRERAAQFGLTDENEESFECNQSFPRALQQPSKLKQNDLSPDLHKIKGLELNSISFHKKNLINTKNTSFATKKANYINNLFNDTLSNSHVHHHNVTYNINNSCLSSSFDKSWAFYNQFLNSNAIVSNNEDESNNQIVALTNPNKALVVINGRTTEILTANNISCDLFGFNEEKLIGRKLKDLLDLSEHSAFNKNERLIECDRLDESGRVVLCSGKIFDAITVDQNSSEADEDEEKRNKILIPISMYMLKLTDESEPKCLCVMEPVQRIVGSFTINLKGKIKHYNSNFSYIFGYTNVPFVSATPSKALLTPNQPMSLSSLSTSCILANKDICQLIPSIKIPMSTILPELKKQSLTGRSCNGENIPLTLSILNKQLYNNEEIVYNCTVSIYTNISGLLTVRPSDYQINSYNATFSRLLLGFNERDLLNKPITYLIPNFFDPSTTSTALQCASSTKQTPLNVNNSYLNVDNFNSTGNRKTSMSFNNNRAIISSNKAALNNNGSFLENVSTKNQIVNPNEKTPSKNQLQSNALTGQIPSFSITNMDGKIDKTCMNCEFRLKKLVLKRKRARDSNIINEFNIASSADYSPNQKCANYIENTSFTNVNVNNSPSVTNTPQSSVKKSLLAKAITNNANTVNAINNLDDSMLSNCSSTSTLSTLSNDSPNKNHTFSNLEVSEFEINEQLDTDEQTPTIDTEAKKEENKNNEEELMDEDIEVDMETLESNTNICQTCKIYLRQTAAKKIKSANKNNDTSASDVSLIAIDNDENNDTHDFDYDDGNNVINGRMNSNKRKASKNEISNEKHDEVAQNLNDSTANGNTNALADDNTNAGIISDKNKKFKNQVTSTPAGSQNAMSNLINSNSSNGNLKMIKINTNDNSKLSTKASTPSPTMFNINDGIFFGRGRHADGSFIRIIYQRKLIKLNENSGDKDQGKNLICIWVSRDPYSDKSIMEGSLDQSQLNRTNNRLNMTNAGSTELSNYLNEYEDMRILGRGAYGFVHLARRKLNKFEVVTKYILKSKINKENWINDDRYGNIPLEISVLCKLDHPNIIKVLEVFQDNEHVQMVMEKHGCGMDLFEFIDRQRAMYVNEPLASYIFRQLISAVSYLHSNSLVHRDIKDENIVINEKFHIKLIDFGSAAYTTPGKQFATFSGTIDYCSPDVLLGNKYYGPELDVWTCGIALYTLVFSENPFMDAEDTIECILKPPCKVSKELMKLLFSILCPKPELRATIPEIESNSWVTQQVDINDYKWEEVIRNTEFHGNNAGDCNMDDEYANGNSNQVKPQLKLIYEANENNMEHQNNENKMLVDGNDAMKFIKGFEDHELVLKTALLSKSF